MTLAAPVDAMADIVRACSDLGCVHIEDYTQFEEGIGVGRAIQSDDADKVSALLLKVRAVRSQVSVFNAKGPMAASSAKSMSQDIEEEVDKALGYIEAIRESESEIASLEDQVRVFEKLAPLNISLDLLTGYSGVEVYVAETANSSKAAKVFADLKNDVEFLAPAGLVAVACAPNKAAEVQMALAELNAKVIQLPSGEGKPAQRASDARKGIELSLIHISEPTRPY